MTIYFYDTDEKPYGCFSNFSQHGFELDGLWWQTSEHYFQAQKFVGTPHIEEIRLAKTPAEAAKMGRSRTRPLRSDWEEVKDSIMQQGLLCKFQTHADIREVLLSTGDELIVENAPQDYYWGCGQDGTGKNRLGEILMTVRTILGNSYRGKLCGLSEGCTTSKT
ncbi:MAG: NADAR family protein [Symploca sp. SIO2B6]|nr:NADAR family protein [Symploca sp. SIO2B6]